ncbi:hypothetical protein ACFFRR_004123 [Megaselia abdita]
MFLRILFALSVVSVKCEDRPTCFDENVKTFNGSFVVWKDNGKDYVYSSPPCFDGNGKLVVRQCVQQKWVPVEIDPRTCEIVYPEFNIIDGDVKYLYKISDKREKFKANKMYFADISYSNLKLDVQYWFFEKPMGIFYDLIDVSPGENYGSKGLLNSQAYPKDQCSFIHNGTPNFDKCDNEHYTIFLTRESSFINKRNCPLNSGVFLHQQDVCFGLIDGPHVTPKLFIHQIYAMDNLFGQLGLLNMFLYNGTTIPGLYVKVKGDHEAPFEVVKFSQGHKYLQSSNVKKEKIEIILNVVGGSIEINCINCNLLWTDSYNYPGFSCFTNAGRDYIMKVDLNSKYFINIHEDPGMAYYWCSGYSIFDTEFIESEKVLAGRNSEHFKEFAFYLNFEEDNTIRNIRYFDDYIKYSLEHHEVTYPTTENPSYNKNIVKHVRTFEVLKRWEGKNTVLCHLITDETATEKDVYKLLKNTFIEEFDGEVNSTEFCEKEYIYENLFWKKTKINEVSTLNRVNFKTERGEIAERKCLGFLYGAEFEEFDSQSLKENRVNMTEFLENILKDLDSLDSYEILSEIGYAVDHIDESPLTPLNFVQISQIFAHMADNTKNNTYNYNNLDNLVKIVSFLISFPPCLDPSCGNSTSVITSSVDTIADFEILKNYAYLTIEYGYFAISINGDDYLWGDNYFEFNHIFSETSPEGSMVVTKVYRNSNLFHKHGEKKLPVRNGIQEVVSFSVLNYYSKNNSYTIPKDTPVILAFHESNWGECVFWKTDHWIEDRKILSNLNHSACNLHSLNYPFQLTLIKDCPLEETSSATKEILTWKPDSEYTVSSPLCENQNGKILTRHCVEAKWIPKSNDLESCTPIKENHRFCPMDFKDESENCVLMKSKGKFASDGIYIAPNTTIENANNYWLPLRMFHPEKEFYPVLSVNPGRFFGATLNDLSSKEKCFANIFNEFKNVSCDIILNNIFAVQNSEKTVIKGVCDKTTIFNQTVCYEQNTQKHLSVQDFTKMQKQMEVIFPEPVQFQNISSLKNIAIVFDKGHWSALPNSHFPTPSYSVLSPLGKPRLTFRNNSNELVTVTCKNCQLWTDGDGWSELSCFTDAFNNYVQSIPVKKMSPTTFEFNLHMGPGFANYWCVGHSVFDMELIASENNVLGRIPPNTEEVAFFLWMDLTGVKNMDFLSLIVRETLVPKHALYLRTFEVIKNSNNSKEGRVLCHAGITKSLEEFKVTLKTIFKNDFRGNVNGTEFCHQEALSKDPTVFWKTTRINQTSTLSNKNYTIDGKLPKRKCLGSFLYGGAWAYFNESLLIETDEDFPTLELEDILENMNSTNPVETVDTLNLVTKESEGNLNSTNFEQIGQILGNVSQNLDTVDEGSEPEMIQGIVSICDNLMEVPCEDCGNSTNEILASIEDVIDNLIIREDIDLDDFGLSYFLEPNFTVISIDPSKKNISGLRFYNELVPGAKVEGNIFYDYIFKNTTFEEFSRFSLENSLSLATYFPENLLDYLIERNKSETTLKIVLKVYRNDNLFQEEKSLKNSSRKVEFNVSSISVPNFSTKDFSTFFLPLTFHYQGSEPECKYWNYEDRSWSIEGISFGGLTNNHLTCNISHLTSFTHLVDVGHSSKIIDDFWLDVITMTCSTLSLIGLLGIFLSAILLKNWRSTRTAQVLIQLCLASFFQIITFFITSTDNFRGKYGLSVCAIFGSLLQYTLLVQFMWMLVIGFSNWMMYSKPFNYISDAPNSFSGFKISAICWGVPLIPVISIIIFGLVDSYETNDINYDLCFPNDIAKIWGFIVPIYSILFMNMVFYILLIIEFWKIHKNKEILQLSTDLKLLVRNLTILFFALGLPWIFGLFHVAISGRAYPNFFSYLFVLTAPLQGFILFIYFVALNPSVRTEWSACIQSIRYKNDKDEGVANKSLRILMHPKFKFNFKLVSTSKPSDLP